MNILIQQVVGFVIPSRRSIILAGCFLCGSLLANKFASAQTNGLDGFIEPFRQVDLSSDESGAILKLMVDEGDHVSAKEEIATLDDRLQKLQVEIADSKDRADCEKILGQVAKRITSWDFNNVRWLISEIEGLVAARLGELEKRFGAAAEVNAVKDAELTRLQDELVLLQEERMMMSKQLDQIETSKVIERQMEEQSLSDAQRRTRRAIPIAKVLAFEKEYGFVTLDAGKTQMLAAGSKLAIRRGNDVVAELRIASVDLDSAVADVIDYKAEPPRAGDEVIAWPF